MRLDHVALATRDAGEPLAALVGRLGGTVVSGGHAIGFRPMQVFLGNGSGGMKVELLEPWVVEQNDFLDRFLTRHGDGPHHLTFKVDDLEETLRRFIDAGFTPVGVDLSHAEWREAFLLPRDAHGTVVQLADSNFEVGLPIDQYRASLREGPFADPRWWPEPPERCATPSRLRRVVLRTNDLDSARRLYAGLLEGTAAGTDGDDDECVELEWPGGGRLLLEQVAGASQGVDRLELEGPVGELTVAGTRMVVRPSADGGA